MPSTRLGSERTWNRAGTVLLAVVLSIAVVGILWLPYEHLWPSVYASLTATPLERARGEVPSLSNAVIEALVLASPVWLGLAAGTIALASLRSFVKAWLVAATVSLAASAVPWLLLLWRIWQAFASFTF